jgi:hypothetical protein
MIPRRQRNIGGLGINLRIDLLVLRTRKSSAHKFADGLAAKPRAYNLRH